MSTSSVNTGEVIEKTALLLPNIVSVVVCRTIMKSCYYCSHDDILVFVHELTITILYVTEDATEYINDVQRSSVIWAISWLVHSKIPAHDFHGPRRRCGV